MSKKIRVKPGKTQSMVGFCAGLVFCFLGLFVVMPMMGAFGIFWTAVAVIITVAHGMNAFSEKGISSHEIIVDDEEDEVGKTKERRLMPEADGQSIEKRLKKAEELYQTGVITREEYERKREEILEEL